MVQIDEKNNDIAGNLFMDNYDKQTKNSISSQEELETKLIDLITDKKTPKEITEKSDFYSKINHSWEEAFSLTDEQSYIVRMDDFRLVQNDVYKKIIVIINEYYIKHKTTPLGKALKTMYNSQRFMIDDTQAMKHLTKYTTYLDKMIDQNNPWEFLGRLNSNEIISHGSPLVFSVNPDQKNPDVNAAFITPPQFTLRDMSVYYDIKPSEKKYKDHYREQFIKFADTAFKLAFGPTTIYSGQDVYDVETELFMTMGCGAVKKEDKNYYNRVETGESLKKYGFEWKKFIRGVGLKKPPKYFIATSLSYLKCCSKLFIEKWASKKWRSYWVYIYLREISRFHVSWRVNYFRFNGLFMRGQQQNINPGLFPLFGVCMAFNTLISTEYEKKYGDKKKVKYAQNFANDLRKVYIRRVNRSSWMDNKTKEMAITKLTNIEMIIGVLPDLKPDPILDYEDNDCWGNFLKITNWRSKEILKTIGKESVNFPLIDWHVTPPKFIGNQPYIVNAYYTPVKNSVTLPLAYIQEPFIDLNQRGIEYNLAHLGFTICHELSHCLDNTGSKYDHTGKMYNWWSKKDKLAFDTKQTDIYNQYKDAAKKDGIDFDPTLSMGENIADISAIAICQEYLINFQDFHETTMNIRKLSFQAFYIYYAFQMRQKIDEKNKILELRTDPHPPDKYRVNIPLSRLRLFRNIYNIQKGDNMYWPNIDTIW
jgi:putative endopeptidase